MMYKTMTTAELLAEKSHMEQLGYVGDVQLLEITEELNKRRADHISITAEPAKHTEIALEAPLEISYTKNARAVIFSDRIEFYGREAGEKKRTLSIGELYQDTHLLSFYKSEYLSNGIKARVMNTLNGMK
jgi:hypothetical protein